MGAVADFVNATKEFANASVIMDTLVILKVTINGEPQLKVFKLTTEQLIEINRIPGIQNNPIELLNLLSNNGGQKKLN